MAILWHLIEPKGFFLLCQKGFLSELFREFSFSANLLFDLLWSSKSSGFMDSYFKTPDSYKNMAVYQKESPILSEAGIRSWDLKKHPKILWTKLTRPRLLRLWELIKVTDVQNTLCCLTPLSSESGSNLPNWYKWTGCSSNHTDRETDTNWQCSSPSARSLTSSQPGAHTCVSLQLGPLLQPTGSTSSPSITSAQRHTANTNVSSATAGCVGASMCSHTAFVTSVTSLP